MSDAHRPTIAVTTHAIAAGHYGAAHAALFAILEAGGNAVDAAVAGGIALGVLQPDIVNVAGVAPIMIYQAGGVITIAGLGYWPPRPPQFFAREHGGQIPQASCAPSFRPRRTPGSRRSPVSGP